MDGEGVTRPGEIEDRAVVIVLDESNHHRLGGGFGIDTLHQKQALNDFFADRRVGMQKERSLCISTFESGRHTRVRMIASAVSLGRTFSWSSSSATKTERTFSMTIWRMLYTELMITVMKSVRPFVERR